MRKIKRINPLRIEINYFDTTVYVWYGTPLIDYVNGVEILTGKEFPKDHTPVYVNGSSGVYASKGDCFIYTVWTENKDVPILVHECYHAIRNLLEDRKITDTNEVYAYGLSMLVKEVLNV